MATTPPKPDDPQLRERARRAADSGQTVESPDWIFRFQVGDETARKELINCACRRLSQLTRKMLKSYQRGQGGEPAEEALENATMRLYWALGEVQPADARAFFLFAARTIRQELLDLGNFFAGPQGPAANFATLGREKEPVTLRPSQIDAADSASDANQLAAWTAFHGEVQQLPEDERALFDLLWYLEVSPAEAAVLLSISERDVKRRWQAARLKLHEALHGQLPDS
jgi:RNA polymerase sigma factor (sigma-70 family)